MKYQEYLHEEEKINNIKKLYAVLSETTEEHFLILLLETLKIRIDELDWKHGSGMYSPVLLDRLSNLKLIQNKLENLVNLKAFK